jgi:hypothetical protein
VVGVHARVVDEDRRRPEALDAEGDEAGQVDLRADVGRAEGRPAAPGQGADDRPPGRLVAPAEDDAGAVLDEELDDRAADAARPAGDDRDLAGERG